MSMTRIGWAWCQECIYPLSSKGAGLLGMGGSIERSWGRNRKSRDAAVLVKARVRVRVRVLAGNKV